MKTFEILLRDIANVGNSGKCTQLHDGSWSCGETHSNPRPAQLRRETPEPPVLFNVVDSFERHIAQLAPADRETIFKVIQARWCIACGDRRIASRACRCANSAPRPKTRS